jgi:hypothetical protein
MQISIRALLTEEKTPGGKKLGNRKIKEFLKLFRCVGKSQWSWVLQATTWAILFSKIKIKIEIF